eukprot:6961108-Ditylum_brightwellii.AAC.1
MHWQEFKRVETSHTSKNTDGTDTDLKGVCNDMFKVCLQELKKHYFPKNLARLRKACLCNHICKPSKLSIKNTTARLWDVNNMLTCFWLRTTTLWWMMNCVTSFTKWSSTSGKKPYRSLGVRLWI